MASRSVAKAALAIVSCALIGCGAGVTSDPEAAPVAATEAAPTPRLTDLARRAVEQLQADPGGGGAGLGTAAPETWWVTIEVDIPLGTDDLDDPVANIPRPFDGLGSAIVQLRMSADAPVGTVGARLQPPFDGLRAELDGSTQVVTTIPGDDPPSTSTWAIANARITRLALTVVDFDAAADAPEIIASVGGDKLRLGPADGGVVLTVAEATAGVTATHPPLTGTTWPPPPAITDGPPDTPSTTQPDPPTG